MGRKKLLNPVIFLILVATFLLPLAGCPGGPRALCNVYIASDGNGGALAVYGEISRGDIYARKVNADGSFPWGEEGVLLEKNGGRSFAFSAVNAISDDAGGFIVAWPDTSEKSFRYSCHLARLSVDGDLLWQRGFIYFDRMISDGSGGVIIAFDYPIVDVTGEGLKNFGLVRVDSQGEYPWGLQGVPVLCGDYLDSTLQTVPDGSGGVILVWKETWHPAGTTPGRPIDGLFAQHINNRGECTWGDEGTNSILVYEFPKDIWIDSVDAVTDGSGGIILSWFQVTENPAAEAGHQQTWDVVVQKVDADGNIVWQPGGVPFEINKASTAANPMEPSLTRDGLGGAIVIWRDMRHDADAEASIYAQKVDAVGQLVWLASGVKVSSTSLNPRPVIVNYSGDEAFISYSFKKDGKCFNIQKITGNGRIAWGENGVTVVDNGFSSPCIASDGQGGVVVAWISGNNKAFVQRSNADGKLLWGGKGLRLNP